MNNELKPYREQEAILIKDIENNELTYSQVSERLNDLYKLIPSNISLNPVRLNNLIIEKYSDDPDWKKERENNIFKIDIGHIKPEDVEEYIKRIAKEYKKNCKRI